jgi:glutathione S-transferase
MKLYVVPKCPFGHRGVFALTAKQLPFELTFFDPRQRPPELEAVGPRAKSPTLFDGDAVVHDSLVVIEYLEERYPERPLLPASPTGRAAARMLMTRFVDELGPRFGAVIGEALFTAHPDPDKLAAHTRAWLDALAPWDRHFEGRTHAVGEAFSLADIVLYTMFPAIRGAAGLEVPEERPHLRAWLDRTALRPGAGVPQPA